MNTHQFEDMLKRAVPVEEYMATCSVECKPKYEARRTEYRPNLHVLEEIRQIADQFIVVAIGADWCKDCISNIPVLAIIHEITGLSVRILGGVKTDPLNPKRRWAVPPSPPEVDSLDIWAIPTILVFTKDGIEVGRIIENPEIKPNLEEELLYFMQKHEESNLLN